MLHKQYICFWAVFKTDWFFPQEYFLFLPWGFSAPANLSLFDLKNSYLSNRQGIAGRIRHSGLAAHSRAFRQNPYLGQHLVWKVRIFSRQKSSVFNLKHEVKHKWFWREFTIWQQRNWATKRYPNKLHFEIKNNILGEKKAKTINEWNNQTHTKKREKTHRKIKQRKPQTHTQKKNANQTNRQKNQITYGS